MMQNNKFTHQKGRHQQPPLWRASLSWVGLCLLCMTVGLAACSGTAVTPTAYTPDPADVDLEDWAEAYPEIYTDWESSVHGEAYLSGDENAPTCNDCHAAPVEGQVVNTAEFHLQVPDRCARCHNDDSLMDEYGVATDVYETYLADFHGTTIHYYAETDPTALRDEAVCSDCHGAHAIYPQDDERSSIAQVNLQTTCAKCHAGASEGFTSAYGHYRPIQSPASTADSTVVFIVKLAYQALIPITLGGMLAYIGLDIFFRIKRKKAKPAATEPETDESEARS